MDEWNRLAVAHGICSAQYRVPVDERLGGAFQRRHIQVAADPPGIADGVCGTAGCELMKEPQGPLSVRQPMPRTATRRLLHEQAGQQHALLLSGEPRDV